MSEPTPIPTSAIPAATPSPAEELSRLWQQGQRPDVRAFLAGVDALRPQQLAAVLLVDLRQRWQHGERVGADDHLRAYPALRADPEAALDLIYGEYLLRQEHGEAPSLSAFGQRFPEHAERLRVQVQLRQAVDAAGADTGLGGTASAGGAPAGRVQASIREWPAIPGYAIEGVLGRGGMGVVYKARQMGLDRLVALKMILAGGHAGEEERRRFLTEAEAVARVRHPGIVQVYDFGTHGGLPFFSLEYCDGGSLADRLADTPLPPREAAALAERVARAVQAAHQAGIVHRDLKPANVLLSVRREAERSAGAAPAGARRNECDPKVTDFGLAKRVEGGGLTQTGNVMGTPSYMPPEQAQGTREVGPLADVYALGAILYECLTGRPPFRAATAYETLLQVVGQEPAPVRQLQAGVPADLETICHKCLQKDPARRYASAEALADDLRRFLDDRPIAARPVGRGERLWRWCKREPVVAGLLAAVFAVLAAGATVSAALAVRAHANAKEAEENARLARGEAERADRKAKEAEQAREKEAEQRGIAEEEKRKAQKAEDDTLASYRASTDDAIVRLIGSKQRLGPQEQTYLERTLKRWQEFARRKGDDARGQAIRAEGHHRVASLWGRLDRRAEARREYETARDLWKKLVDAFPADFGYQRELARTHHNLGLLLRRLGENDAARGEYEKAIDLKQKLADAFPADPEYRQALARTHNNLAALLAHLGKRDEASVEYKKAIDLRKRLVDAFPTDPGYQRELAYTHNNLGLLLARQGKRDEARKEYEQALGVQKKLAESFPAVPEHRQNLASTHLNLGLLLKDLRKGDEARGEYGKAIGLLKKLAADSPAFPEYRQTLALTHNNLGLLLYGLGKLDEARKEYEKALDLQQKLADGSPTFPEYQRDLAITHNNLAFLLADLGQLDEARKRFEQALGVQKKLADTFPAVFAYQVDLGGTYGNLGNLALVESKPADSLHWFDLAVRTLTPAYEKEPRDRRARRFLRSTLSERAQAYDRLKKHAEAVKDWDRAIALSPKGEQPSLRASRANSRLRAGQVAEAVAEVEELTKSSKWTAAQWYGFACVYAVSSGKLTDTKQEHADRAMTLLNQAVRAGYKDAAHLRKDTDLDPIRGRDDFKKLLADLHARPAVDKKQ
jgi:serine/threonine-protein kinase